MQLSPVQTAVGGCLIGVVFVGLGVANLLGRTSFSVVPSFRGMPARYLGFATVGLGGCFIFLGTALATTGAAHVVLLAAFGVSLACSIGSAAVGRRRP